MKIIKDGDKGIMRLWGKQTAKPGNYRLLKYLIHETVDKREYLCNNVTGELVQLSTEESDLIKTETVQYSETLQELIEHHFLVPTDYDERNNVTVLRKVLKVAQPKSEHIVSYTILPTTACNARCFYCFEKGSKIETMTEQTAEDTVRFIAEHCGLDKKISIIWFGGEPTVAANRIDQICKGLMAENIQYTSMMYTNGYLCDEELIRKAVELWHLNQVQMSVDGTEQVFNRTKAFVNVQDSPYQRVKRNIGYMLDKKITVAVRMNVDYFNCEDFATLVKEFLESYGGNPYLNLCAYPLIGEYADHEGKVNHADEAWIAKKVEELNQIAKDKGFIRETDDLPKLATNACMADSDATITIGPDGNLVRCGERFEKNDAVGTIGMGITNVGLVNDWKMVSSIENCFECAFYPNCIQLSKCSGAGHCHRQGRNQRYRWNIQHIARTTEMEET